MRCFLLSGVWFFMLWGTLHAQQPELIKDRAFEKDARAAVDSIYNFRPDAAEKLMQPWMKKHPDHPLWSLMEGMNLWWQLLSDLEDTSKDDAFFDAMKKADYEASRLLNKQSTHTDALIIKAVSNGYIARQHANRDSWVTSLNSSRTAFKAYQYLSDSEPNLPDLKLAEGLKLYYSELLPERYPVTKTVSWALPDGDKKRGLETLEEASREGLFARAESVYFLGNINYLYEKDYEKASGYLEDLYRDYPRNSYYARTLVKNYVRLREYDRAIRIIDDTLDRWKKHGYPFEKVLNHELLTLKGYVLYNEKKYDDSLDAFLDAIEAGNKLSRSQHRGFQTQALYFVGLINAKQNNPKEARRFLEEATDMKSESSYLEKAKKLLKDLDD